MVSPRRRPTWYSTCHGATPRTSITSSPPPPLIVTRRTCDTWIDAPTPSTVNRSRPARAGSGDRGTSSTTCTRPSGPTASPATCPRLLTAAACRTENPPGSATRSFRSAIRATAGSYQNALDRLDASSASPTTNP
jgi:hypothetical protein